MLQFTLAEEAVSALLRPEVLGDRLYDVVNDIVKRTVERTALWCGIPEVETWAVRWLSGANRSIESAADAQKVASHSGATGKGAYYAAWAAIDAARASHARRQTEAAGYARNAAWAAARAAEDEKVERAWQFARIMRALAA